MAMDGAICLVGPLCTAKPCPLKPALLIARPRTKLPDMVGSCRAGFSSRTSIVAKASDSNQRTKPNSIVCVDCEGNGMVLCSQCKGSGVNAVDHFNGRFKAGGLCWLCRGKKEILCGNCNGAGFVGGFMNTTED